MSAQETTYPVLSAGLDFDLMRRQIFGVLRLELRQNLISRRAMALYFLAFFPVFGVASWAMFSPSTEWYDGPLQVTPLFSAIFFFYLMGSIYLSTLFLFMSLFRSEILERSLHYYFLTPVRREIVVLGKYLSALIAGAATLVLGTLAMFLLIHLPWGIGAEAEFLFRGPGLGYLVAYLGIAFLGCAAYGAVFLLAGLLIRNPVVPALLVWTWELINFVLPVSLKKASVFFYLQALYPIPLEENRLFAVVAENPPAWAAIGALLLMTVLLVAAACWRARRMEVAYGVD